MSAATVTDEQVLDLSAELDPSSDAFAAYVNGSADADAALRPPKVVEETELLPKREPYTFSGDAVALNASAFSGREEALRAAGVRHEPFPTPEEASPDPDALRDLRALERALGSKWAVLRVVPSQQSSTVRGRGRRRVRSAVRRIRGSRASSDDPPQPAPARAGDESDESEGGLV